MDATDTVHVGDTVRLPLKPLFAVGDMVIWAKEKEPGRVLLRRFGKGPFRVVGIALTTGKQFDIHPQFVYIPPLIHMTESEYDYDSAIKNHNRFTGAWFEKAPRKGVEDNG